MKVKLMFCGLVIVGLFVGNGLAQKTADTDNQRVSAQQLDPAKLTQAINTDAGLRKQFLDNPNTVLGRYRLALPAEEAQRLARLNQFAKENNGTITIEKITFDAPPPGAKIRWPKIIIVFAFKGSTVNIN